MTDYARGRADAFKEAADVARKWNAQGRAIAQQIEALAQPPQRFDYHGPGEEQAQRLMQQDSGIDFPDLHMRELEKPLYYGPGTTDKDPEVDPSANLTLQQPPKYIDPNYKYSDEEIKDLNELVEPKRGCGTCEHGDDWRFELGVPLNCIGCVHLFKYSGKDNWKLKAGA